MSLVFSSQRLKPSCGNFGLWLMESGMIKTNINFLCTFDYYSPYVTSQRACATGGDTTVQQQLSVQRQALVLCALTLTLLSCHVHRGDWPTVSGVELAQRIRVMRKRARSDSCSVVLALERPLSHLRNVFMCFMFQFFSSFVCFI